MVHISDLPIEMIEHICNFLDPIDALKIIILLKISDPYLFSKKVNELFKLQPLTAYFDYMKMMLQCQLEKKKNIIHH